MLLRIILSKLSRNDRNYDEKDREDRQHGDTGAERDARYREQDQELFGGGDRDREGDDGRGERRRRGDDDANSLGLGDVLRELEVR
jgi:hypothetical protein